MKHLTLFFSLFPLLLTAQSEEFEYDSTLVSVSFRYNSSDTSSRQIIVKNDTTFSPYLEPHYEVSPSGTIISEPVAYVSGSSAKVKTVFKMNCDKGPNQPAPYVYIKGVGVGHAATYDFGPITVAFDKSKKTYTFEDTCVKRFVKYQIGYFKDFNIEWKISLDNQTWFEAGTSRNTVYVLLDKPAPENSEGFDYLETIFYTSCKYGKGVQTGGILFNRMKAVFSSKQVKRVDGEPLYYYKDWNNAIIKTNEFIKKKDGQCIAWMKFFMDCHRIHGIKENDYLGNHHSLFKDKYIGWIVVVQAKNVEEDKETFYCPFWKLKEPANNPKIFPYTHINVWDASKMGFNSTQPYYKDNGKWKYAWILAGAEYLCCDSTSNSTICSQNNQCPKSRFDNHQFVYMYGQCFDPSYGIEYLHPSNGSNFPDTDDMKRVIQKAGIALIVKKDINQKLDLIRQPRGIDIIIDMYHSY